MSDERANSTHLLDLAAEMLRAISNHRATRGQSAVGRDGRARYGARELAADRELDISARAFAEAAGFDFAERPAPRFATEREAQEYLIAALDARREMPG